MKLVDFGKFKGIWLVKKSYISYKKNCVYDDTGAINEAAELSLRWQPEVENIKC